MDEGYKKLLQDLSNHSKFLSNFDTLEEEKQTEGIDTGLDLISQLLGYNIDFSKVSQNIHSGKKTKTTTNIDDVDDSWETQMDLAGDSNTDASTNISSKYEEKTDKNITDSPDKPEVWQKEQPHDDDDDGQDENTPNNTNKKLKPANGPKKRTPEQQKKHEDSLTVDVGSSKRAIDARENIVKGEDVEIEFTSCGDNPNTINDEFGKELFSLYEQAKQILNSDMLPLIGIYNFYKLGLLNVTSENHKKILGQLEDSLFIQLTKAEYDEIKDKIYKFAKKAPTLKTAFDKICERDIKYKKPDSEMAIMVYALLWVFHYNISISIDRTKPIYGQMVSNQTLFSDKEGRQFIFTNTCQTIAAIGVKIKDSLNILKSIKSTFIEGDTRAEYNDLLQKYITIVGDNKTVLALLKRRDDWNNKTYTTPEKRHQRFEMDMPNKNDTIYEPLTLKYNDSPLPIEEPERGNLDAMRSHNYTFYGFDAVFESNLGNSSIANRLASDYIKDDRPLCFIGYGQSGSGKTSTLVYLDVPGMEEDGILMELLKTIEPKAVTVSMIEIYQGESAKASDETCLGIGTKSHPEARKIIPCYPLNDNGVQEKPRVQIPYVPMESNNPVMRYVTIGEVLDKQFDDKTKGKIREKNKKLDDNLQSTFSIGSDSEGMGWFYTHGDGTVDKLDKDFGLKHYILMGFECREVGPTSNNKQSSRSHVVVSLELDMGGGKTRSIFVCDLAGVENVFDCTPGSTDSIRMKAKTKANKNYSNDLGKGNIEEWSQLDKKRVGNIVKYVHKDVHIATSTDTDPNCWPDGSPNEAGDIGAISENYAKELMKIFWYFKMEGKNIIAGQVGGDEKKKKGKKGKKGKKVQKTGSSGGKLNPESVFSYFKKKLEKLPLKKDSNGGIVGLQKVKNNIKSFWSLANAGGGSYTFEAFLKGEKYNGKGIDKGMANKIDWDKWAMDKAYSNIGQAPVSACKIAFNDLEAPDCVSAYSVGFQKACEIRKNEGYIINNTLAQLTKDIKRIAKYSIKERLEYEAIPMIGIEGVKRQNDFPCLYADTIDNYNYYSATTNPLMDWYDIDDPTQEDFGMILSAMCLLKEQNTEKWSNPETGKKEKLNFLKQFKFVMCTVLNETYIMNFGGNDAKTPAGNLIYVNNPPLPPFINVGILEQSYKEFMFYERDPRGDEKKYAAFLKMYNNFLNLVVKMFKHPNYEEEAIKLMQGLGEVSGAKPKLIYFESEEDLKANFKDAGIVKYIIDQTQKMLVMIKKNNNATYIGTIQTTEEVNRVSEKIIISEAVNQESKLSSIDETNINVKLLKKLFESCFLHKTAKESKQIKNKGITLRRGYTNKKQEISTILYECLYEIDKLSEENNMLKACKTMKERDIDSMMNAIETVFPIMTRYVDPKKLQVIWEKLSSLERAKSLNLSTKINGDYNIKATKQMKGKVKVLGYRKSYPFPRDLIPPGKKKGKGKWSEPYTEELFSNAFITDDIKKATSPLLAFNNHITGIIKLEPSIPFLKQGPWNLEREAAKEDAGGNWGFGYEKEMKKGKRTEILKLYPSLAKFFEAIGFKWKEKGKRPITPFFTTLDFYNGIYAAYQGETFKSPNKWDEQKNSFPDFAAVKAAKVRKVVSGNDVLSSYDIEVAFPPDEFAIEDDEDEDGDEDGGQEGGSKKYKKKRTRRKNKKIKRKQTRRKK